MMIKNLSLSNHLWAKSDKPILAVFKSVFFILTFILIMLQFDKNILAESIVEFQYDAIGNLIFDGARYYEYNEANKLVRVRLGGLTGQVLAEYSYDFQGQRVKKVENGVSYYYVGKHFETKTDGSHTENTSYYFFHNIRLAKENNQGSILFYHNDHLGSPYALTNSFGNLVERSSYFPFGKERESGPEKYSYTGKEKDKNTEYYYFEARYYWPEFAHFTQADTIDIKIYDPQSLNRYAYVKNNPINLIDPTGNEPAPHDLCVGNHCFKTEASYNTYLANLRTQMQYQKKAAKAQGVVADIWETASEVAQVAASLGDAAISLVPIPGKGPDIVGFAKGTGNALLAMGRLSGFLAKDTPKSISQGPAYLIKQTNFKYSQKAADIASIAGNAVDVITTAKSAYKGINPPGTLVGATRFSNSFVDMAVNSMNLGASISSYITSLDY